MPQPSEDAPEAERAGRAREARGDDAAALEGERKRIEAEELASFERRAEWWRLHYGDSDEVAERLRDAREHAERLPQANDDRAND